MSDSAEIVLTFSVLTCQAEQFISDSAEILIFTQSNSRQRIVKLSDAFRKVCSAEQGQIFSLESIFASWSLRIFHHGFQRSDSWQTCYFKYYLLVLASIFLTDFRRLSSTTLESWLKMKFFSWGSLEEIRSDLSSSQKDHRPQVIFY